MTALPASNRVQDAYARMKAEIRSSRLPPGYQATEPELAVLLGMSRTPVREAVIRLQAEGLVDVIPRRGVRVRTISLRDMEEIYEILTALEPEAAYRVALRGPSEEELAPLDAAVRDMQEALRQDDLTAWAEADDAFHSHLLHLHGNARMSGYVASLMDQAHRVRMVTLRMRKKPVKSTQEHDHFLKLIRAGDAKGVRAAFRKHRKRAAKELLGLLREYGLSQL